MVEVAVHGEAVQGKSPSVLPQIVHGVAVYLYMGHVRCCTAQETVVQGVYREKESVPHIPAVAGGKER